MPPLDFPSNPVVGQVYNGYTWTGVAWEAGYTPVVPNLQLATYANAAARDAAITSPTTGMQAYLTDIKQVTVYNGSAWKSDMAGLVPIVPPTVNFSGGSATANSLGVITFSGVSGISLNNVFSSSYRSYKILLSYNAASGAAYAYSRMRNAGVDDSGTYVTGIVCTRITGANFNITSPGQSAGIFGLANAGASGPMTSVIDVINPAVSGYCTTFEITGYWADTTSAAGVAGGGLHSNTSVFDGFTIYPSASTIGGTIQVFGYNS